MGDAGSAGGRRLGTVAYQNRGGVGACIPPCSRGRCTEVKGRLLRPGRHVIFHTDWLSLIEKDPKRFGPSNPHRPRRRAPPRLEGRRRGRRRHLGGVEVVPFEKDGDKVGGILGVQQNLIPMSGIHILENINTAELAKGKAHEFMFVLVRRRRTVRVRSVCRRFEPRASERYSWK
jgi:hypothetical protein